MEDNFSMWNAHDREVERQSEKLPVCENCGRKINADHYFDVENEILCERCMVRRYRRNTEDFKGGEYERI